MTAVLLLSGRCCCGGWRGSRRFPQWPRAQAVTRAVPEGQRRRIHTAAAEYYYGLDAAALGEERRLAQLAYHAGEAGLAAEAARSYLGARRARPRAVTPTRDAERLYSRALAQPAPAGIDARAAYRRPRPDALSHRPLPRRPRRFRARAAHGGGGRRSPADCHSPRRGHRPRLDGCATRPPRCGSRPARALRSAARRSSTRGSSWASADRPFARAATREAAGLLERAVAGGRAARRRRLRDAGDRASSSSASCSPAWAGVDDAQRALDRVVALGRRARAIASTSAPRSTCARCSGATCERRIASSPTWSDPSPSPRELGQASLELMGEFNLAEFLLFMDDAPAAEPHVRRAAVLDRRISGDAGRADVALLEARLLPLSRRGRRRGRHRRPTCAPARTRRARAAKRLLVPSDEVLCADDRSLSARRRPVRVGRAGGARRAVRGAGAARGHRGPRRWPPMRRGRTAEALAHFRARARRSLWRARTPWVCASRAGSSRRRRCPDGARKPVSHPRAG